MIDDLLLVLPAQVVLTVDRRMSALPPRHVFHSAVPRALERHCPVVHALRRRPPLMPGQQVPLIARGTSIFVSFPVLLVSIDGLLLARVETLPRVVVARDVLLHFLLG